MCTLYSDISRARAGGVNSAAGGGVYSISFFISAVDIWRMWHPEVKSVSSFNKWVLCLCQSMIVKWQICDSMARYHIFEDPLSQCLIFNKKNYITVFAIKHIWYDKSYHRWNHNSCNFVQFFSVPDIILEMFPSAKQYLSLFCIFHHLNIMKKIPSVEHHFCYVEFLLSLIWPFLLHLDMLFFITRYYRVNDSLSWS